jgi:hypothetical protein
MAVDQRELAAIALRGVGDQGGGDADLLQHAAEGVPLGLGCRRGLPAWSISSRAGTLRNSWMRSRVAGSWIGTCRSICIGPCLREVPPREQRGTATTCACRWRDRFTRPLRARLRGSRVPAPEPRHSTTLAGASWRRRKARVRGYSCRRSAPPPNSFKLAKWLRSSISAGPRVPLGICGVPGHCLLHAPGQLLPLLRRVGLTAEV